MFTIVPIDSSLRQRFNRMVPRRGLFAHDPFLSNFSLLSDDMNWAFDNLHRNILSLEPWDSFRGLTRSHFPLIHREIIPVDFGEEMRRNAMSAWNDAYEVDNTGNVNFRVCYDVKDFPEDKVKVSVENGQLTVEGEKETKTTNSSSHSRFCRTITLPSNIEMDAIKIERTNDGVLVISAPVKKTAISGGKPLSVQGSDDQGLKKTGQSGLSTVDNSAHIEFALESGTTKDNIKVSAQRHEVSVSVAAEKKNESITTTRNFNLTLAIDPDKSKWTVDNDLFIFEAPYEVENSKME